MSEQVDMYAKYFIYIVILFNIILRVLVLTKAYLKKLQVFHTRRLRRIIDIKWIDVVENKITNIYIRKILILLELLIHRLQKEYGHSSEKLLGYLVRKSF